MFSLPKVLIAEKIKDWSGIERPSSETSLGFWNDDFTAVTFSVL